jgi:hypothetical protein
MTALAAADLKQRMDEVQATLIILHNTFTLFVGVNSRIPNSLNRARRACEDASAELWNIKPC